MKNKLLLLILFIGLGVSAQETKPIDESTKMYIKALDFVIDNYDKLEQEDLRKLGKNLSDKVSEQVILEGLKLIEVKTREKINKIEKER